MIDKIVKINEIDKVYSEKLSELLSKGLRVYSNANGGTQGEMCKITLADSKDVYSLIMYSHNTEHPNNRYERIRVVSIKLEKFINKYRSDLFDQTLWNNSGEEIFEINFYKIGHSYSGTFVTTIEEWNEWKETNYFRFNNKYINEYTTLNLNKDKILSIVKRHKGYKTIKKDTIIKVIKSKNGYNIKVDGKKDICISFVG